ncbi:DUF502 domain-containing protein [Clostridium sediminicola]|uniref:DUF502 domain-containing protein n=1 Tax=Clostridium sediminicola TaxID=3114879 RepID=UPI0031F1CD7E
MKQIKNLFITGLATTLPLAVTYYIIKTIFLFIDSFLKKIIVSVVGDYFPGVGFLLTIGIILLIGFIANNVIGKKTFDYVEEMINKVPIINSVYASIKELSKTFSSSSQNKFSNVVSVEFPNKGIQSIGFITNENLVLNNHEKISVFIPTTPNPTNGFLIYVDRESVKKLDITVDEAIKMVISMSTLLPKDCNSKK